MMLDVVIVLPKNKDLFRNRPVCSHFKHFLKPVLTKISRATNFLLVNLPQKSANLDEVDDVTQCLRNVNELNSLFRFFDLRMYPFTFDVKEMFTNLDHNQIREALNFVLSFYKVIQVDQVYVSQNSRKCFLKKPPQSGFTKISFQDVCNFVEFDLNLSFSTLGKNVTLHQKMGIPMGSP